jgi:hypothetical protein
MNGSLTKILAAAAAAVAVALPWRDLGGDDG